MATVSLISATFDEIKTKEKSSSEIKHLILLAFVSYEAVRSGGGVVIAE